jgi:hypothetical protein
MRKPAPRWDGPPLEAWRPWSPADAARVLAGCAAPWCVVGGWAIDLAAGRQTRRHEDLEIAVARGDFAPIRAHLEARGFVLFEAATARRAGSKPAPGPIP